jgi:2-oxoglutarate dehydrogenase E1 component
MVRPGRVKQLVLTSGRLYYDLIKKRVEGGDETTAIVRLEQLYPFPAGQVDAVIKKYKQATRLIWAQDEPENMGSWMFIRQMMPEVRFEVVSRPASGSPAGGLMEQHNLRLEKILSSIFNQKVLA